MAKVRRWLPYLLAVPLGVGGITLAATRPVEARGQRVEPGDVIDEVLGVGVLESDAEVGVSFEAAGRVTGLFVDEGATVALGDALGTVDASDAARELGVAVSAGAAADAAVQRAQAELERARSASAQAVTDRVRADTLAAAGAMPASDRDAAVERDASARATVKAMESGLREAEHAREVASRTSGIRQAQVADGRLYSPLSGLVVRRQVEEGQLVTPGVPAFTIVGTDAMRVRAWVDETALGRLRIGQPARLAFRSDPARTFPGTVERIGREVDRQTHELLVDIAVTELPTNFAIGQRADAWIELGRREAVLQVPRGWCTTEPLARALSELEISSSTCATVVDGRAVARSVTLGLVGRDTVEVVSGLASGDVVLAPGTPAGKRVRVAP